jgi:hypothetical protein
MLERDAVGHIQHDQRRYTKRAHDIRTDHQQTPVAVA